MTNGSSQKMNAVLPAKESKNHPTQMIQISFIIIAVEQPSLSWRDKYPMRDASISYIRQAFLAFWILRYGFGFTA